jgi:transcriptional regulator with PAS, ATPase and Fis domain
LQITRIGGNEPIRLNLTVIAASNRNLEELIEQNAFREDLFYRLNRFKIFIPPLRERMDDIPLLCGYFVDEANRTYGKNVKEISEDAYKHIYSHSWPGNVRELKNTLFKAVLFSKRGVIGPEDLDLPQAGRFQPGTGKAAIAGQARKKILKTNLAELKEVLRRQKGNISAAAAFFGVTRLTIYNNLKKQRLSIQELRSSPVRKSTD